MSDTLTQGPDTTPSPQQPNVQPVDTLVAADKAAPIDLRTPEQVQAQQVRAAQRASMQPAAPNVGPSVDNLGFGGTKTLAPDGNAPKESGVFKIETFADEQKTDGNTATPDIAATAQATASPDLAAPAETQPVATETVADQPPAQSPDQPVNQASDQTTPAQPVEQPKRKKFLGIF